MIRKQVALLAIVLSLAALVGCRSAHVTSAILYIDQQMYQRAVDVLHDGLEYSPNEAEAFFYLGESHTHLAEEAVNDNDFLEANRQYGMAYGYYQKTVEFDETMRARVNESLAYSYGLRKNDGRADLASAQSANGDLQQRYFESAEGQYRLAFAAYPDSTGPIKTIARMKMFQADQATDKEAGNVLYGEALALLDQVLESRPEAYSMKADKANVLNKLGRSEEAGAIYDELIVEHPEDTDLLLDIAGLAAQEQKYERAADLYAQVAVLFEQSDDLDDDAEIYPLTLQAARFYHLPGVLRYADALTQYAKALRLEDVEAGGPKADTLFQKQKLHYDFGKSLMVEMAEGAEMPLESKEQFEFSVNTGNALVAIDVENAFAYFYLGMAHVELGDVAKSAENLKIFEGLNALE